MTYNFTPITESEYRRLRQLMVSDGIARRKCPLYSNTDTMVHKSLVTKKLLTEECVEVSQKYFVPYMLYKITEKGRIAAKEWEVFYEL